MENCWRSELLGAIEAPGRFGRFRRSAVWIGNAGWETLCPWQNERSIIAGWLGNAPQATILSRRLWHPSAAEPQNFGSVSRFN